MSSIIEKWYLRVKMSLFTYKKGFFVLPYVNSTPQLMWQSLQKMPFIKFTPSLSMSESNTPFLHAKMYYHEVEKNLVIFYNEINYKTNVTFAHHNAKNIPLTYYCLTGFLSDTSDNQLKTIINDIHFHGQLWILHKPEAVIPHYHFKNSNTKTIIFYFTKEWLMSYLQLYPEGNEKLLYFIESNHQSLGQTYEINQEGKLLIDKAAELMKSPLAANRQQLLGNYIIDVMQFFKLHCLEFIKSKDFISLDNVDLLKVTKAEQILITNLMIAFPGIPAIAAQVGLSETKLKNNFKQVYQKSIFQYYRDKQMELAKEMLTNNPESIKQIAIKFGYENSSKFSAAFKKQHGYVPSEIKN